MKLRTSQQGYTLVELILTIAILALIGALGVNLFLAVLNNRAKVMAQIEVQQNAHSAMERIVYEIRRAYDTEATTDFDTNLATTPGATLDLDMTDAGRDPTTFEVNSGVIQITQGAGSTVYLTSNDVTVTDLTIEDRSTGNGRSNNLRVNLTVESVLTGLNAPEPTTIITAVELRYP